MTKYDRNFTDELRERLSVIDVVGQKVALAKKGQNYWGLCPFHNEKTPSFSVNDEKGFYHCFGCGEHGDVISFVMKTQNMDFLTSLASLAQMAGMKLPDFKPKSQEQIKREDSYLTIVEKAAKKYQERLFEPDGKIALDYIKSRGFSEEAIKKHRLGYAPGNNIISSMFKDTPQDKLLSTGLVRNGNYGNYDFFRGKLMFPIFNIKGEVIAFSGRSLDGSEPKYINTADTEMFHKRKVVFGLNFARDSIYRNNRSIVVEGQIDAIQMQDKGFPETVAPLGTALTEDHINVLTKLNRNIIFCFDGDRAGQKAAQRACSISMDFLRDNSDIRFVILPNGRDPDDVLKSDGKEGIEKLIKESSPLVDFLWDTINNNFVTATPGGRALAEKFLNTEIDKIKDSILKNQFFKEFNSRKFNEWDKWTKKKDMINIKVPEIDNITEKNLQALIYTYPELAERHAEFLKSLDINFDDNNNKDSVLSIEDAEKLIVSLKLKKHIELLQSQKDDLFKQLLAGDKSAQEKISKIDKELSKSLGRATTLVD